MRIALLAILGGVFCIASEAYARQWQDASGTYKVEAELVSSANGNVWLNKQDGQVVCVPINQLSVLDREFVRTHAGQTTSTGSSSPGASKRRPVLPCRSHGKGRARRRSHRRRRRHWQRIRCRPRGLGHHQFPCHRRSPLRKGLLQRWNHVACPGLPGGRC